MNANYLDVNGRTYYSFEEPQPDGVEVTPRQSLQTLDLPGRVVETPEPRPGFWRRQFGNHVTRRQKAFDWTLGVIMPVICFVFDPIVFGNTYQHTDALLGGVKTFAYVLSFTAIMATMAWLLWGEKLKWLNAFLSGLFAVSSLAAFAIGLFLLPFSILGLILLIGVLGFTPLLSSLVYLRNSVRAFRSASSSLERNVLLYSFALSALASAVIPYLLNLW